MAFFDFANNLFSYPPGDEFAEFRVVVNDRTRRTMINQRLLNNLVHSYHPVFAQDCSHGIDSISRSHSAHGRPERGVSTNVEMPVFALYVPLISLLKWQAGVAILRRHSPLNINWCFAPTILKRITSPWSSLEHTSEGAAIMDIPWLRHVPIVTTGRDSLLHLVKGA